jgi:manganese transport protein
MTYLCLDIARRDWHFTKQNKAFQVVFATWIAVPALLTPFWSLPALLKAIIAMVGNLLLAPVAVAIIFYFINQRRMGEFKAGAGRNLVLLTTLVFALSLAITGVVRFLR